MAWNPGGSIPGFAPVNALTVSAFGGVVLTDANAPIAPGSGCQRGPSTRQVVCASAGVVEADLGDRADTLSVDAGVTANVIARGQDGDDVLHAGPSVDRLEGGAGNDRLDGAGSGDDLIGGAGTDTADYSARTQTVSVALDGEFNDGEAGERDNARPDVERVLGGSGADFLTGNSAANTLVGNAGDDALDGGRGTDVLLGGDGRDKVDYSDRTSPLTITLDGVANDGAPGENDVLDSIQDIDGGQGSDTLVGNGNANAIFGAQGDDVLRGLGGDDNLTGTAGADVLDGGSGAEDSVSYGGSFEGVVVTLDGVANDGASFERDQVDPSVEIVTGSAHDDDITGDDAGNGLFGDGGNDVLHGRGGADVLQGGDGNDTLVGGLDNDLLLDTSGKDTASYADHSLPVTASVGGTGGTVGEADAIGKGIENLTGGGVADTLNGDDTDNSLDGGPGNDHLNAFGGADVLTGGIGSDVIDTGNDTAADRVVASDQSADRITCAPPDQVAADALDVRLGC